MNLDFSPEEIAFREEVGRFIADHYPARLRGKQDEGEDLGKVVPAEKMGRVGTVAIETSVEAGEGEFRVSVGVLDAATGETGFAAAEARLGGA